MGRLILRVRLKTDATITDYPLEDDYTLDEVNGEVNDAIEDRHNLQLLGTDGNVIGGEDGLDPQNFAFCSVTVAGITREPPKLGPGS